MPEFVPVPEPLKVGELFAETQMLYRSILDTQNAVQQDRDDAAAQQSVFLPQYDALLQKVKNLRATAMLQTLDAMGKVLAEVQKERQNIQLGVEGLAEFDQRLADITARYLKVYGPFFQDIPLEQTVVDTTNWTADRWAQFESHLEGPVLFWTPAECEALWNVPNVPDCNGPDYLEAWSMLNQIQQASAHQEMLVGTVAGFLDYKLIEFQDEITRDMSDLATQIQNFLTIIQQETTDFLKPLLVGLAVVGGVALGIFVFGRLTKD